MSFRSVRIPSCPVPPSHQPSCSRWRAPSLMAQETSDLGEVIVTAQKRSESLQDVPISIDALGEEKIEGTQRPELQGLRAVPADRDDVSRRPARAPASTRCTCAASRPAATARRRPRSRASACTSTSSRSRRSRATSTSTSTTSRASRRSRARRARCTARARRRARSASSRTSRIRPPSLPATRWKANYVDMEEPGYVAEGFVNLPLSDNAALRFVGWAVSDAGWVDNKLATRTYTDRSVDPGRRLRHRQRRSSPRKTTTRPTPSARALRCASTSARTGPSRRT